MRDMVEIYTGSLRSLDQADIEVIDDAQSLFLANMKCKRATLTQRRQY